METKLFSPLLSSANNIVKMKRSLPKRARDYNDFINWLDTSNKDIKKIKLPKKKKVEDLKFSVGSALGGGGGGGGNGGGILGSLLAALGIRKGANFLKGKLGLPKGKFKGSYEDIIKNLTKKGNLTKGENFALRDYKRLVGKGGLTNNDAAFRALGRNRFNDKFYSDMNGETLTKSGTKTTGGAFSSETAAQYRQAGRSGGGGFRGAPRGGLGGIAGPLNIVFAGFDFMGRKGEGQSNLQAGVGAGGGLAGGLAGAWAGGKAGAAVGAGIGALFGGVGAAPGAVIGGIIGSLAGGFAGGQLGGNLADKFTGADKIDERLKAQETKQREAASSSDVTFASITDKFDKVVSKFEKLKLGMTGIGDENVGKGEESMNPYQEPGQYPPINPSNQTYDGPVSGDTFFPLPGGEEGKSQNQQFGASRDGGKRSHAGLDMVKWSGDLAAPVAAYKTGKVVESVNNGYNGYVTIDHGGGLKTRYYHTSPSVNTGDVVYGGQQIANLYPDGQNTHLHFEVYRGGTAINPSSSGLGQKIPAPLTKDKAKQQHEKTIGNTAKPGVNTIQRQQSPEEFFKGTQMEDIFKDKEKRSQFFGEERQFKNTMVKTPVTDPEVKQALQMYNAYVRDIRSRRQDQVKAQPGDPIPAQISQSPPTAAQQSAIFLMGDQSQQVASQPQVVPIPIGNGGGGGGVAVIMPSEGQILNSLWTTMLLTNLSSA